MVLGVSLFSPGAHCKRGGHKTSCLAQWLYNLQMSIQIPVQETQFSCNYSQFSPAFSDIYLTERTIAFSHVTCQSYSWHLTAAIDREVTNQINEIYLQLPRAKQRSRHVMSFVFRRFSQNCGKRLLASSCLSVRTSARNNSAPTGRIFMKFNIGGLFFLQNLPIKLEFH